jgi:hypothetical protein
MPAHPMPEFTSNTQPGDTRPSIQQPCACLRHEPTSSSSQSPEVNNDNKEIRLDNTRHSKRVATPRKSSSCDGINRIPLKQCRDLCVKPRWSSA